MRRLSLAACFAVAALGCSNSILCNDVSSIVSSCESFACASCKVSSHCQAGVDVNTCAQVLSDNFGCTSQRCEPGLTFNPTGAEACLQGYEAQDCADNLANTTPAACTNSANPICVGP